MEMTIKHETKKPALHRADYTIRVFHEGATPDRLKIRDALAHHLKAKPELVMVRKIAPEFGAAGSVVDVSVYANAEALARYEHAYIVKRNAAKAAAKEGDA